MKDLGCDIGGTSMRVAELLEGEVGIVLRSATPAEPDAAVSELVGLAEKIAPDGIARIFCGIAARLTDDGAVRTATNLPLWNGFPFAAEVGKALAAQTVVINDAELDALGEAWYGAGKGFRSVAYLGLGTGIGTAYVIDGIVEPGSSEGEVRAQVITLSSGASFEELSGGRSLLKHYEVRPEELPREVWNDLTPLLAECIRNAITLWAPDVLVLGGSLMNEETAYRLEDVERELGTIEIPIRRAALGDKSGLYGALALRQKQS